MKISCITTVFNEGPLLVRSIHSILEQTHENLQYIIIDDGSSEETRDILASIKDDRILLIRQANDGLSSARNKGLEQIAGDYVCFMDADDIRPAWAFRSIAETAKRDDPDLILCRGSLSELNDRLQPFYDEAQVFALADLLERRPVSTGDDNFRSAVHLAQLMEPQVANKVLRTKFLKRERLVFPNGHFFEDIFFHSLAVASAKRISIMETVCFTYFRRYGRPQVTSARGDVRFDILAVSKLTMEMFAHTEGFQDPVHRAAVLASCMKLARWCETMTSQHHRQAFRDLIKDLLGLVDQRYLDLPVSVPTGMEEITRAHEYLRLIGVAQQTSKRPFVGVTRPDEEQNGTGFLKRLWSVFRA